jgi:SAM-dependent methyltransferase
MLTASGSDKAQLHGYGWWYDAWRKHCPSGSVLEVGVFNGSSAAAFRAAGYQYTGIDRSLVGGVDVIQCTTPDFAPACAELDRRGLQYDLVIDDGSHRLECQAAAISALWRFVRPGGCLWIEDIQSVGAFRELVRIAKATAPHVQALDVRHLRGRYDDLAIAMSSEPLAWSAEAAQRAGVVAQ